MGNNTPPRDVVENMTHEECIAMAEDAERRLGNARERLEKTRYFRLVRQLEDEFNFWQARAGEKIEEKEERPAKEQAA